MNKEALKTFFYWIKERERIRIVRAAGGPKPWTKDPILQTTHFCNVRREHDRVTKEIREVMVGQPVNMLPAFYTAARMFNKASTARLVVNNWPNFIPAVKQARERGPIFHTAYVVSTCGRSMDKVDYCAWVIFNVSKLKIDREWCGEAFNQLRTVDGLGSFMAGQIIADLKNDRYLTGAFDWEHWSCMGPGSKKGLEYIFEVPINEGNYLRYMVELTELMPDDIFNMHLHMQDLQNCLCEFSKYWRIKNNMGGRRRPFNG